MRKICRFIILLLGFTLTQRAFAQDPIVGKDFNKPPYVQLLFLGDDWNTLNLQPVYESVKLLSDNTLLLVHVAAYSTTHQPVLLLHRLKRDGTLIWRRIFPFERIADLEALAAAPEGQQGYLDYIMLDLARHYDPKRDGPYRWWLGFDKRGKNFQDEIIIDSYQISDNEALTGVIVSDNKIGLWLVDGNGNLVWHRLPSADLKMQAITSILVQGQKIYLGGLSLESPDQFVRPVVMGLDAKGAELFRWEGDNDQSWRAARILGPEGDTGMLLLIPDGREHQRFKRLFRFSPPNDLQLIASDIEEVTYLPDGTLVEVESIPPLNYWVNEQWNVIIRDFMWKRLSHRRYTWGKLVGLGQQCDLYRSSEIIPMRHGFVQFDIYEFSYRIHYHNTDCWDDFRTKTNDNFAVVKIFDERGRLLMLPRASSVLHHPDLAPDGVFYEPATLPMDRSFLGSYAEKGYYTDKPNSMGPALFRVLVPGWSQ